MFSKQKAKEKEKKKDGVKESKGVSSESEEVSSLKDFTRTIRPSEVSLLLFCKSREAVRLCNKHIQYTLIHTGDVIMMIETGKVEKGNGILSLLWGKGYS